MICSTVRILYRNHCSVFSRDEEVDSCITDILKEILNLYNREGRVYIFEYDESQTHHSCTYEVVSEGVSAEKRGFTRYTYQSIEVVE